MQQKLKHLFTGKQKEKKKITTLFKLKMSVFQGDQYNYFK